MVELPEAAVIAEQINSVLIGKKVKTATANYTPHAFAWYTGEPERYNELLVGKTIKGAAAHGYHIEIKIDDMILLLSTPIKYHTAGEKIPKKHQLLLEFDDSTTASCTVQMWGVLFCFREGETVDIYGFDLGKNKPSPLTEKFDKVFFDSLIDEKTKALSAKAFLATEQRIPGLGNGVLQDILWTAKIHPKHKIVSLSEEEIDNMYQAVKSVLIQMKEQGGRNTERDLFGCQGGYKPVLCKNTVNKPCPVCGTIIKKEAYLGGSIYYCENCQRL